MAGRLRVTRRLSMGTIPRDPEPFPASDAETPEAVAPPQSPSVVEDATQPTGPQSLSARIRGVADSVRRLRAILRLRSFDTSTPEGRSSERYRRAALTTVTSMAARGIGIFTGLAWVRLSLSYLGEERYGLWMAIGSLLAWANLADLGLARGMQNHLSQANGQDDPVLAS